MIWLILLAIVILIQWPLAKTLGKAMKKISADYEADQNPN